MNLAISALLKRGTSETSGFDKKKSILQNYLLILAWSLVTDFYNTLVCLVLLWFQHVRHTSQGGTQGTQCSTLYISGQIPKICFLQFNIVICLLIILFGEKNKNCKAPQFCKISLIALLLIVFRVRDGFCKVCNGF